MYITEYRDMLDTIGQQYELDWLDFTALMVAHSTETHKPTKESCPMIGGWFNGRKLKSNWLGQDWIGLDLDHNINIETLVPFVLELGYHSLLYTTFNHRPDHPKLRIIIPLNRFIDNSDEFEQLWIGFNHLFCIDGVSLLDPACKNSNRGFFVPTVRPGVWVECIDGRYADPDHIIQSIPTPPERVIDPQVAAFQAALAAYQQDYPPDRPKHKPGYHNNIFDSNIVKKDKLEEYYNTPRGGNFHVGFHALLCSIVAVAKLRGFPLGQSELAVIAAQIDQQDAGGPYYSASDYQTKARFAIKTAG